MKSFKTFRKETPSFMKKTAVLFAIVVLCGLSQSAFSQPIVDTVKTIQKQNDKVYREIASLDPYGDSYTFTNVIKWHITDRELFDQIKDALTKEPFNVKPDEYRIDDIYLFSAPAATDRVEPFHILLDGETLEKKKKKSSGLGAFGEEESGGTRTKRAFQGKAIVQLLHRKNPTLLENINTIQGDNVEIPGEIVPHGSQLVKDTRMRFIFSKMFDQFYSKRAILDEQRKFYGLPTTDEFAEIPTPASATDSISTPIDVETTPSLPEEQMKRDLLSEYRASKYEKTVDISLTDLRVNASKNLALEIEMGNKEVGLPFWSSGVSRFWINLKNQIGSESNVKLGLVFPDPFTMGTSDWLVFPARKLSGTFGGSVDAYFAGISFFSGFNLPLALKFSLMPSGQSHNNSIIPISNAPDVPIGDTSIPGRLTFYREALILQFYVPTIIQLDLNNFIQFSVGFGIDNVYQSFIPTGRDPKTHILYDYTKGTRALYGADQADKIQDLQRVSNTVSPHVEIDYVNQQSSKFGLSAAYDHLFTFGGWIELIEDRFRIELSYSAPIIRDPRPWEPSSFFLITPRFYF
jgi:hypothetical protein